MNVEQAFRISTTVAQMKKLTAQLVGELDSIGSPSQQLMASNIDQVLDSLTGSLRPLVPTDEDVERHPATPR